MFNFGNNLKTLRKEMKIKQSTLARRIGISDSMISRYENGEIYPPFETLLALARILNVSLDELCGIQSKGTASLYGLSDEQIAIIQDLSAEFRKHNNDIRKKLTLQQYELVGKIIAEFTK